MAVADVALLVLALAVVIMHVSHCCLHFYVFVVVEARTHPIFFCGPFNSSPIAILR